MLYFLFFSVCAVWDLSSPTRDETCALCIGNASFNHWTTWEVPALFPLKFHSWLLSLASSPFYLFDNHTFSRLFTVQFLIGVIISCIFISSLTLVYLEYILVDSMK